MGEAMLPYVSAGLASLFADRPGPIVQPEERERIGVVLFADISGFSALTERLASEGSSPDKIGEILSGALGSVVDAVTEFGGDVMTFAGDAVLASWNDDDLENTLALVLNAVGHANQALAITTEEAGDALGLRTGIAMGRIWEAVIGGVAGEWHHLTAGQAVLEATTAVGLAKPGELVAGAPLAQRFGPRATSLGQYARIDFAAPPPFDRVDAPAAPTTTSVDPFVPLQIREAVAGGHGEWIAELRRITMAFVRLDRFETTIALDELHDAVQIAQAIVNEYGGSVARVLYDDKGLVLVVRWTGLQASRDIGVSAVLAGMELIDCV
jgi:class 3 adenylate cyclase